MKKKIGQYILFTAIVLIVGMFSTGCFSRIGALPSPGKIKMENMNDKKKKFADLFDNVIHIIDQRLANFDESKDALSRDQLEFLREALSTEKSRVLTDEIEPYQGQLFGPIKSVIDWGEPEGSELRTATYDIELFYRANY
jgi:hypothetical protein